ncbi:PHD finger protein rhinoceros isoform X2 [Kryptolebias marmoratus]|nr:PHD finger protein rhinoceros isoform X2 [Kryptolebias marmoratus]XP_017267975.1 PHD finger protein rhinoceros isoform X2 [Kryptolebias marmoratus]
MTQNESTTTPTTTVLRITLSTTQPTSKPTASGCSWWRKECLSELMVQGGLIVACAFFLATTLLLTCKVCRLSRRVRKLSRSEGLNSGPAFSGANKGESKSRAGAKETAVLMSYVSQTNLELDSAASEQDAGAAKEDGQKKAEEKKKEGEPPKGEEAPPPAAEAAAGCSTFSEPQEEAAGSESTPAAAAAAAAPSSPCPEGTKEAENQP